MQHIQIKLYVDNGAAIAPQTVIPVFHRWIQQRTVPELLIDVADYSHVPKGPGVILIGHEAYYSIDEARGVQGLLYQRRTVREGTAAENLRHAWQSAVTAAAILEGEPELAGRLKFRRDRLTITFNDRLLHPNTPAGQAAVEPEVRSLLDEVLGPDTYTVSWSQDPRERLTVEASRIPA